MKNFSLVSLLALSLFACGQQEKEENPFGKADGKNKNPGMSEYQFKETCAAKGGTLYNKETLCVHTPYKVRLTSERLREDFKDKIGLKLYPVGTVSAGSLIWGDKKDGQSIRIYVNGGHFTTMEGANLPTQALPAGKVEIEVRQAEYGHISVTVAECFTRTNSAAPCVF